MHELSLAQQMVTTFEKCAAEANATKVVKATVKIGALTCVESETLTFAFGIVSKGTLLEHCELIILRVPLTATCSVCSYEGEVNPLLPECPRCGAFGLEVRSGRELVLESIEIEDEQDA